ncbi:MAG: CHAT domain-containing protein [Isosphaerales bacterium]
MVSHLFELTIQNGSAGRWPVVAERTAPGAFLPVRAEGVLGLDREALAAADPDEYGVRLGQALFQGAIRDAFQKAREKGDRGLHVLLCVEDKDLRLLRWERLCAPLEGEVWEPVALDQRVPFSIHLIAVTDRPFPPISRNDLQALILVANPEPGNRFRLAPFDADAATRAVLGSLGPIHSDLLGKDPKAVGKPTLDALCEALTSAPYTLLHIVGHGCYKSDDREPVLFLDGEDGAIDPVTASRLISRLRKIQQGKGLPHFVFLSCCESASPEAEGGLGGLGQRLVRELGVPAVLAMTDPVRVESALKLGAAFYGRLREHGEPDRALVESYAGLAERSDIKVPVPALFSRLGGRPLFSLAPDGQLTDGDLAKGLERFETLLPERAPSLIGTFRGHAATLRGTLGADPQQLSPDRRAERQNALAAVDALCLETTDLAFEALADGQAVPSYDARCPFKGLEAFRPGDRAFFFGRKVWIDRMRARLGEHNFLAVLGPSGSGKSSVVLAGLVPALQESETNLELGYLTPGSDPSGSLSQAMAGIADQPAVVVVDQFEEVFTLCNDDGARLEFLDRLLALAKTRRVVVTMRADFWGDCAPHRALRELMLAHQELIPPLTTDELRLAMSCQVGAVGLRFETGLVGTVLADVPNEPGAMPLLQHALLELWIRRHGRWLRGEEYQAIGGVQRAIAVTADAVYAGLSKEDREKARALFLRLTRVDEAASPDGAYRDTRQRVGFKELLPDESDPSAVVRLVQRLADARLVVTNGLQEVEVAHETLIRHWPLLRGWLDEDRAALRLRQDIRGAALEWDGQGRRESNLLHRGERLRTAKSLLGVPRFALNKLEKGYVQACDILQQQEDRLRFEQRWTNLDEVGWGVIFPWASTTRPGPARLRFARRSRRFSSSGRTRRPASGPISIENTSVATLSGRARLSGRSSPATR